MRGTICCFIQTDSFRFLGGTVCVAFVGSRDRWVALFVLPLETSPGKSNLAAAEAVSFGWKGTSSKCKDHTKA